MASFLQTLHSVDPIGDPAAGYSNAPALAALGRAEPLLGGADCIVTGWAVAAVANGRARPIAVEAAVSV